MGSTSPRAARWNKLAFEKYLLTGTICIAHEGKGNRVDPRSVNSRPYRTTVEVVASVSGQVVQAIVGDETIWAKWMDHVGVMINLQGCGRKGTHLGRDS